MTTTINQALATLTGGMTQLASASDLQQHTTTIAAMMGAMRFLGRSATGQRSGKAAVLDFLTACLGKSVSVDQLAAASGIQDCARRVRELRADGWRIVGGTYQPNTVEIRMMQKLGLDTVRGGNYALISPEPMQRARRKLASAGLQPQH